jgi:hypothetical protein
MILSDPSGLVQADIPEVIAKPDRIQGQTAVSLETAAKDRGLLE